MNGILPLIVLIIVLVLVIVLVLAPLAWKAIKQTSTKDDDEHD
jgi:hypothetical protein